jgi:hypothetical protein
MVALSAAAPSMQTIGWALSCAGLVVIFLLIVDLGRRGGSVPGLRRGRGMLRRWQGWLWVVTLFASYCGGDRVTIYSKSTLNGVRVPGPVPIETKSIEAANPGGITSTGWGGTHLPFYQSRWSVVNYADGRPFRHAENQGLVVPWMFVLVLMAYCLAVRRERKEDADAF